MIGLQTLNFNLKRNRGSLFRLSAMDARPLPAKTRPSSADWSSPTRCASPKSFWSSVAEPAAIYKGGTNNCYVQAAFNHLSLHQLEKGFQEGRDGGGGLTKPPSVLNAKRKKNCEWSRKLIQEMDSPPLMFYFIIGNYWCEIIDKSFPFHKGRRYI